ncbi:MAG: hypothetical protein JWQ77_2824, partial [Jatrophihabitans sp.]|nr:hypothetical protein [Jatrophihabitans sp.]
MNAPYPLGAEVVIDAGTCVLADGSLYGGSPRRVLRLSAPGRLAWAELASG